MPPLCDKCRKPGAGTLPSKGSYWRLTCKVSLGSTTPCCGNAKRLQQQVGQPEGQHLQQDDLLQKVQHDFLQGNRIAGQPGQLLVEGWPAVGGHHGRGAQHTCRCESEHLSSPQTQRNNKSKGRCSYESWFQGSWCACNTRGLSRPQHRFKKDCNYAGVWNRDLKHCKTSCRSTE